MSHVIATPQALADAAGNLAAIGSTLKSANSNAAPGLAGVQAPGADLVSAYLTSLFAAHAQTYQVAGSQAATLHDQFVQVLQTSAGSYAKTEAANAMPMQQALGSIGEATQTSAGHLIGNGGSGATGAGGHGGASGPPPGTSTSAPVNVNMDGGGPGVDGHAAAPAAAAPQVTNVGGGGATGGGLGGGTITGGGGGGGPLVIADPSGVGGGAYLGPGAMGVVPPTVGPALPAAPLVTGVATAPDASAVMAGGYPAMAGMAGLGGSIGDSTGLGALGQPVAPMAAAPVAPAAQSAIQTAAKTQPLHPDHPDHTDQPTGVLHDIPALIVPLPRLRGLREKLEKLRQRSGLRDKRDWREKLRHDAEIRPWGRDELLSALGLRPPQE
jgi:PE family